MKPVQNNKLSPFLFQGVISTTCLPTIDYNRFGAEVWEKGSSKEDKLLVSDANPENLSHAGNPALSNMSYII